MNLQYLRGVPLTCRAHEHGKWKGGPQVEDCIYKAKATEKDSHGSEF